MSNHDETDYSLSSTRPMSAPRQQVRQPGGPRKVVRFTLDLEQQQHQFLKLFSYQHGLVGSKVMRTMLYLLEADPAFAQRVLSEVYAEESPVEEQPETPAQQTPQ